MGEGWQKQKRMPAAEFLGQEDCLSVSHWLLCIHYSLKATRRRFFFLLSELVKESRKWHYGFQKEEDL